MNFVSHSDVPPHKGCNPGVRHPCVMYCEAQLTALVEKIRPPENLRGSQPVVLNGQRLYVCVESNAKPRYIPGPVWRWMVRLVVKSQKVTTEHRYTMGKP